jgi:hypothetical protein
LSLIEQNGWSDQAVYGRLFFNSAYQYIDDEIHDPAPMPYFDVMRGTFIIPAKR